MQTAERVAAPIADDRVARLMRRNRWLTGLVVLLVVVAAALGVWAMAAPGGDDPVIVLGGGDLTAEQEVMLETLAAYHEAWNAGDAAAVVGMFLPSGYMDSGGRIRFVADGSMAEWVGELHGMGFESGETLLTVVDGTTITMWSESNLGMTTDEFQMTGDGSHITIHR